MNKQQGFTLLEILISLTLLTIIMGLLFSALNIGANSWQKSQTKLTEINRIASIYQFLQTYLSTALPLNNPRLKQTTDSIPPLAFQGDKQKLQFISSTRLGLQLFTLEKQKDIIKVSLLPFFSDLNTAQEHITLLTDVNDFNIQYFGQTEPLKPATWQNQWLKQTVQPTLLKITIKLNSGIIIPDWFIALKTPAQDIALQPIK